MAPPQPKGRPSRKGSGAPREGNGVGPTLASALSVALHTPDQLAPTVSIGVIGADGQETSRITAAEDGTFQLPAGSPSPAGFDVWSSAGTLISRFRLDDIPPGTLDLHLPPAPAHVSFFGQVVGPDGQPVGGVSVIIRHGSTIDALTVTDSNGAWLLTVDANADGAGDDHRIDISGLGEPIDAGVWRHDTSTVHGPYYSLLDRIPQELSSVAPASAFLAAEPGVVQHVLREAPQLWARGVSVSNGSPCSPYAPRDSAVEIHEFTRVHPFPLDTNPYGGLDTTLIQLAEEPLAPAMRRYGVLFTFEQTWKPLGYALGDLLFSLPLAPCEDVKLATVDWYAQQRAQRASTVGEEASSDQTVGRTRSVADALMFQSQKSAEESQVAGGLGVAAGNGSVGGALSIGATHSWGDSLTNAAASSTQDLTDQIRQTAALLRSTRAMSIVEVTEAEQSNVSTREIRNHNHAHTLTFQYSEVLERFLVATRVNAVQPVIMVPFAPVTFDAAQIDRHGDVLRSALRDPSLQPLLDEWLGRHTTPGSTPRSKAPKSAPSGGASPDPSAIMISSLQLRLSLPPNPDYPHGLGSVWWGSDLDDYLRLRLPDQSVITPSYHDAGDPWVEAIIPLEPARSLASLNGLSLVNTWQGGSDDDHQRAHFPEISFATLRNGAWHVEYDGNDVAIPDQASIRLLDGGHTDSPSSPSTPNPPAGAQPSAPTTPAPQLIAHLNANRLWYTAAILQEGDPLLLWTILAGLVDDEGRALVDIVEPTICANVGNYLAFRLSSTDLLPSPIRGSLPHGWGDPGIYAGIGSETVVVLPSPGTFVEAQLGSCSAAEKIDETVFWRWQDAPCDGSAPDITADMLASRSQGPQRDSEFRTAVACRTAGHRPRGARADLDRRPDAQSTDERPTRQRSRRAAQLPRHACPGRRAGKRPAPARPARRAPARAAAGPPGVPVRARRTAQLPAAPPAATATLRRPAPRHLRLLDHAGDGSRIDAGHDESELDSHPGRQYHTDEFLIDARHHGSARPGPRSTRLFRTRWYDAGSAARALRPDPRDRRFEVVPRLPRRGLRLRISRRGESSRSLRDAGRRTGSAASKGDCRRRPGEQRRRPRYRDRAARRGGDRRLSAGELPVGTSRRRCRRPLTSAARAG